jgi:CRP-like cAMP-binding protein
LVKLTCGLTDGREAVVHLCQPGRFIDTISHVSNGTYATTATALTDCTVFRNETTVILESLCRDPEATRLWVQQQAAELRQVHRSALDHRTLSAQQRFEKLLWTFAALLAGGKPSGAFRLPRSVTETQMAEPLTPA